MSTCHECRKAEMVEGREAFDYGEMAGLPYSVILQELPVSRCPACDESVVSIADAEGLHRLLGMAMVGSRRPLLWQEIRFLRKLLDWTADKMSVALGVDAKTISRWENGKQAMGPTSERLLRLIVRGLEPVDSPGWVLTTFESIEQGHEEPRPVQVRVSDGHWSYAA